MGWKQNVRSISAAIRAADREAQRRSKALQKQQELNQAENAIEDWKNYILHLTSAHKNIDKGIDWYMLANKKKPVIPKESFPREREAKENLDSFEPSFFDFLRGGTNRRIDMLRRSVLTARSLDEKDYDKCIEQYNIALQEWEEDSRLAPLIINRDEKAIFQVFEEMKPSLEENIIGHGITYLVERGTIHAKPEVHSDEIIPKIRLKKLASGRLSQTKMPIGEFNELYQDYVCSIALKVAGDLFSIFPYDEVFVTCLADMLNRQTGHIEKSPILSVHFVRQSFASLRLNALDPSESMKNFRHQMSFKKTMGFEVTEVIEPVN